MRRISHVQNTAVLDVDDGEQMPLLLLNNREQKRLYTMPNDPFPFTRSFTTFKNSATLFIYIANTIVTSSSPLLEWSEVRWKDLMDAWHQDTTFADLLQLSTVIHNTKNDGYNTMPSETSASKTKMILHCLPKTASTTLRVACNIHLRNHCQAIEYPIQQDPYGYRDITEFYRAITECTNIDHFCVQGGSANMDIVNYNSMDEDAEGTSDNAQPPKPYLERRESYHFVHMIPFRNFHAWVESAIKQIYSIDGNCFRVEKTLEYCLGYRELYFELYSKSVMSLLARMVFHFNKRQQQQQQQQQQGASGNDTNSIDTHHIVLYNYKDTESIVSQMNDLFHLAPLSQSNLRLKDQLNNTGTCHDSDVISEMFRTCHSDALMKFNESMTLTEENKRRTQNHRNMIRLLQRVKQSEKQDDTEESGD